MLRHLLKINKYGNPSSSVSGSDGETMQLRIFLLPPILAFVGTSQICQ